jgi:hypothetical protein
LRRDGTLGIGAGPGFGSSVPAALARRFFADLQAAGPLDELPVAHCMKSASFGSWTRITYLGKTSPDLSCPSSSLALRALTADAAAVSTAAGVHSAPRRPVL